MQEEGSSAGQSGPGSDGRGLLGDGPTLVGCSLGHDEDSPVAQGQAAASNQVDKNRFGYKQSMIMQESPVSQPRFKINDPQRYVFYNKLGSHLESQPSSPTYKTLFHRQVNSLLVT